MIIQMIIQPPTLQIFKSCFDYEIVKNNTNLGHGGSLIRLSEYEQIKDYDFVFITSLISLICTQI